MAPTPPEGVPASLVAGTTWIWTTRSSDYPVSEGWALSYRFRGASTLDTAATEAVASGETWTVTLSSGRTASLTPGNYVWHAVATGSGTYAGRVHVVDTGVVEVTRNLALADDGDAQSWEEKTLAVVEAVLSNKVTDDVAMYMIAGRQVLTIPFAELLSLRAQLRRQVAAQRNPKAPYAAHKVTFRGVA